ncbi:MAG: alpha/beta hydrolase [Chloroflexi bacterium]|nr:alpha/beta hydrolase [Chloroflexota bacterium]
MRKALLAPLTLLAGAAVAAVLYAAWRHVVPRREASLPDPPDADSEEVRFRSRDGVRLFGLLLPGRQGHPGVVLCHGYFKSLTEPLEIGLRLNREGYHVLLFDFRGCGRSDGRFTTIGYKETWDVLAAVDLLRSRLGAAPIGVLGISMGAAAAIMAAAQTQDIAALVADSPYAHLEGVMRVNIPEFAPFRWMVPFGWVSVLAGQLLSGGRLRHVRPVDDVARISPRPILFVYGERDSYIPHQQAGELFEAAGEPKELWLAAGSDHAVARLDHPQEYTRRVLGFFGRYLLGRPARRGRRARAARTG